MKCIKFLTEFVKNPQNIGAITPSSERLAVKMVETINFEEAKYIVELGPGTGPFTKEVMKRKKKQTLLILIESNEVFVKELQKQFHGDKSVVIIHGLAENIKKYMGKLHIEKVDYVLSGLPFTSLSKKVSSCIIKNVKDSIQENGQFIIFQYSLAKKSCIQTFFPNILIKRVWLNIPPAYVFLCKKERRFTVINGGI
ncbi:methyltransferase (plasmid) [Bacillus mycoides]|nr:methyltransferase [Bacillus mycoides]